MYFLFSLAAEKTVDKELNYLLCDDGIWKVV